ncbi:uncharacterized protein N7482_007657 [Penicillium canariense]|uniref:Checkpoint protein RAD24-like helical bundle domain-containing protein n=1 Tax=Penicillium canariense TaxID=189055 RepID=A0A9W9LKH9_9EURO|nr:uncharacterized protein N7482_007657 [Penicillium canariense]KAJ5160653.1 hypothetical protein N7482_007657 [Penicillium canariense]
MDGRSPKRQRRSARPKKDPPGEQDARPTSLDPSSRNPVALSSRPETTNPRARASQTQLPRAPSSSPSPKKTSSPPKTTRSKSLHTFFQPATEAQRWSAQKFESKRPLAAAETTLDADLIEDDYDSYDEIFTQHLAAGEKSYSPIDSPASHGPSQARRPAPKKTVASRPKSHSSKRFLMPPESKSGPRRQSPVPTSIKVDQRPWAQRFGPSSLDEIAVHKKKVSDVQNWLEDAFSGRRRERLLVLRGPAGSGKTTAIALLSKTMGFDLIEWRNPSVSEFAAHDYVSASTHFEEFLGRGDRFGGLDLEDAVELKESRDARPRSRRVLLVEEFPTILSRNSSSLAAFRSSLQRYVAASTEHSLGGWMHPPVVMIVSETLLSSATSISDNLTVHRLLGPTMYNHPGTTIIDFNSIAPTFMQKALRLVLEKEARTSQRSCVPGQAVLDRISETGDIRSALSSLEFLCLKGDQAGKWGGSLAKAKRSRGESTLTPMEQESLEMISQRETSLGMFHAVGKIVYNKRLDPSLMPGDVAIPPSPPGYLARHRRFKVSQVAVNELLDETGTDISTFICALHENYPPSCDGDFFTDNLNACIEALSDSDILSPDRRPSQGARTGIGVGATPFNAGVDMLRQDEISFQVAARGLLFALPYPVKRKMAPGNGRSRAGDAYKMLYPASLRLWRRTEEIDGLVDSYLTQMLDPSGQTHLLSRGLGAATESTGVKFWKSLRVGYSGLETDGSLNSAVTMMSRPDALLHQLPYMAQIRRKEPDGWQLNQITSIQGGRLGDEADEDEPVPAPPRSQPNRKGFGSPGPKLEEEKLILSDDDIVDD